MDSITYFRQYVGYLCIANVKLIFLVWCLGKFIFLLKCLTELNSSYPMNMLGYCIYSNIRNNVTLEMLRSLSV